MFLYLEDTTNYPHDERLRELNPLVQKLKEEGMYANRHIKIFAFPISPQPTGNNPRLPVIYVPDGPFTQQEMEEYQVKDNPERSLVEQKVARALFRFATQPELDFIRHAQMFGEQFPQFAMRTPLDFIHGANPTEMHIDLMSTGSLKRLGKIINLKDPRSFVTRREGRTLREITRTVWGVETAPRRKEG